MSTSATPAGERMNKVYDEIRMQLTKMPADRAEAMRGEIITLFVMIKCEVARWEGKKHGDSVVYRKGSVVDAAGGDYEAILRVAHLYSTDFSEIIR